MQGAPWQTVAVVEFYDQVSPEGIEPYTNHGVMIAQIRWGKATDVHIFVDTDKVVRALEQLRENGIAKAGSPPITG